MIAACTRFWAAVDDPSSHSALDAWIMQASKYAEYIIVAIRSDQDHADTCGHLRKQFPQLTDRLILVPVHPWGAFTPALNALVYTAATAGEQSKVYDLDGTVGKVEFILFQSIEVKMGKLEVRKMIECMDDETLVVGTALDGHDFSAGKHRLDGLKAPWNTNALWHLKSLAKTGFLMVSDGIAGNTGAAIEEVAVVSLHQFIANSGEAKAKDTRHRCKLIKTQNVVWQTGFESSEIRKAQHLKKMQTKLPRAEAQNKLLGIPMGSVEHIEIE